MGADPCAKVMANLEHVHNERLKNFGVEFSSADFIAGAATVIKASDGDVPAGWFLMVMSGRNPFNAEPLPSKSDTYNGMDEEDYETLEALNRASNHIMDIEGDNSYIVRTIDYYADQIRKEYEDDD
jgi:hypothetical protein